MCLWDHRVFPSPYDMGRGDEPIEFFVLTIFIRVALPFAYLSKIERREVSRTLPGSELFGLSPVL